MTAEVKKMYEERLKKVLEDVNEAALFDLLIDLDMDRDIGGCELYVVECCRGCERDNCDGCEYNMI